MNKSFFYLFLFLSITTTSIATAAPYIGLIGGGTAGFNLDNSKLDTRWGYYLGGRVGFSCMKFLRLEEELSYQTSKIHSLSVRGLDFKHVHGQVKFWSLMTNALIDFDCPFIVSPYIGGGIGYTRADGKGKGTRGSHHQLEAEKKVDRNDFAWQGIVGIKYLTCFGWETSLEYRYFKVKDVDANHKIGAAITKFF